MEVIGIAFVLRHAIPIPFISLHDALCTIESFSHMIQIELTKAAFEICFLLVLFHAFKVSGESSIDMTEIAIYTGQFNIAVLLMENHPKIKA